MERLRAGVVLQRRGIGCNNICRTQLDGIHAIGYRGIAAQGNKDVLMSPYLNGYVYCSRCELFFVDKPGVFYCECCRTKLRHRARNIKRMLRAAPE